MKKYVYSKHGGKIKSLVIWGRDGCPFCSKAKDLANRLVANNGLNGFTYYKTTEEVERFSELKEKIKNELGVHVSTVPQILGYMEENPEPVYIGGFTDLYTVMPA